MDAGAIGGSPIELTLEGKVYRFAPLDVGDIADFEAWLVSARIKDCIEALGASAPSAERIEIVKWAHSEPVSIGAEMSTMRGTRQLLWLSLRKHQPEIALEAVGRLVNMRTIGQMQTLVDKLAGLETAEEGESDSPPAVEAPPGQPS